ncbi:DUF3306 domain-containing protein [Chromohalobacter israelensis]|uniref:DUF3306 domain-containing protein n=1 Tax=Chromohalobacter israelensis TaxID=141390 RepID=UPI001CC69516|nr:DUF3306 domain-containing protein [Chromohalobacter salexigens]MBZ5876932.1 DUF3306 domain-containing protein [Chromohalobacter salexigens]
MSFMQRWSRRKHESAHQAPQEPAVDETASDEAAETAPEPSTRAAALIPGYDPERPLDEQLPDPDALGAGDDFRAFLLPGVGDMLKRRALRRMFKVGNYNVRDGLDDYDDDYASLARMAPGATEQIRQWLGAEPDTPSELDTSSTAPPSYDNAEPAVGEQEATSEDLAQHEEEKAPNDPLRPPGAST